MKLTLWIGIALLFAAGPAVRGSELEDSYKNLQDAVAKKDAALVKKLAAETSEAARAEVAEAQPATGYTKPEWDTHVQRAKDLDAYSEYALSATAVQQTEPETLIDLIETLEKQNPKSKYLEDAYAPYYAALKKTGAEAKIIPSAEKALASQPANTDVLIVLGDKAWAGKNYARAGTLGARLAAAASRRTKPEGVAAADWEKRKGALMAQGYYWAGMAAVGRNDFYNAEKNLKVAVPLMTGNEAMLAQAMFSLALSEYQLGRTGLNKGQMLDGAKHFDQVAKMKSELAQQAWSNAHKVREEAERMR